MSVNKVIIVGNLGQNPEVRQTQSGASVAQFSVATNDSWMDKAGQKQERTEWHRVVVWGKQAENCQQFLAKGRQVYVEGRLQTRQWQDKEGQTRYTTEVHAQTVQFLGGKGQGTDRSQEFGSFPSASSYSTARAEEEKMPSFDVPMMSKEASPAPSATFMDDDLPF